MVKKSNFDRWVNFRYTFLICLSMALALFGIIFGYIKDGSLLHSDWAIWGMLAALYTLHLFNSKDLINMDKKEVWVDE